MSHSSALDRAMAMVADLRARCPWDRVQTRHTLRPYLIEEAHELAAALAGDDPDAIRAEVGDLLLHLAWQLVLGAELGEFTPDRVADDLVRKMQRRHPHLFDLGDREPWERLKRREHTNHLLSGLPPTLPALMTAFRLQERAASIGFDWPDMAGPLAKVREELDEVTTELHPPIAPMAQRKTDEEGAHRSSGGPDHSAQDRVAEEIGDLLFAVVNLARKAGVEPSAALEGANQKFRARFNAMEEMAAARGIDVSRAGLEELDRLWDEVKVAQG